MKYRHIHKHITEIKMAIAHLENELYSLNNSLHNIDEMLLDMQEEELAQEHELDKMFISMEREEMDRELSTGLFQMKNIA